MRMLVIAALIAAPAAATPADPLAKTMLAAHNLERARVAVPPLRWDDRLAKDAAEWAHGLKGGGALIHEAEVRDAPHGENLWMGTAGAYEQREMVRAWVDEKAAFRPGVFPEVTRSDAEVGHYTQMIWRETEAVGCAVAGDGEWDYLVCRYDPPGNVIDRVVY